MALYQFQSNIFQKVTQKVFGINYLPELRQIFMEQWNAYKKHAWGYDILDPLSGSVFIYYQ